jgi:hypothetical protein
LHKIFSVVNSKHPFLLKRWITSRVLIIISIHTWRTLCLSLPLGG